MNKLILPLMLVGFSWFFLPLGSLAATPGIDSLKKNTIESFLQKANNPKASLHKKLVELNQVDGRNSNGIFPQTLTVRDIQIFTIDGENQFGSYCYGLEGKPAHLKCSRGVTETYLVLIPAKMGVHKAIGYQRFLFVVKSTKKIEWMTDEKDKKYNYKESIEISEPTQLSIEKLDLSFGNPEEIGISGAAIT